MTDLRYLLSRGAKSVNRSQLFSRLTKLDAPNIKVTPFQIRVHFCFIPLATRGRYQKIAIFGTFEPNFGSGALETYVPMHKRGSNDS